MDANRAYPRTFDEFIEEVRAILERKAQNKGYTVTPIDGPNQLFDFVKWLVGSDHVLGEIVYKVKRYKELRNPEDIAKAAAWCFLIWRTHESNLHVESPNDAEWDPHAVE